MDAAVELKTWSPGLDPNGHSQKSGMNDGHAGLGGGGRERKAQRFGLPKRNEVNLKSPG